MAKGRAKLSVSLPREKTAKVKELAGYSILIYGEKKIGKTSLAAQFPDAFFLMFEPGGKALELFAAPVKSWKHFVAYLDTLEREDRFDTVVIDTIDLCYEACYESICKANNITHPNEMRDHGQTWRAIKTEFQRQIHRLLSLGRGVILLSHAKEVEIMGLNGQATTRIQSTMSGQAHDVVDALIDIWIYYGYKGRNRYLFLNGNEHITAGARNMEDHFLLDNPIYCGKSAAETYQNFQAAFNNDPIPFPPREMAPKKSKPKPKLRIKRSK